MKFSTSLATATAILASTASAQYAIDPNSVTSDLRQYWCGEQTTQCPLICLQPPANSAETISNTCDWTSLTYSCVCANGLSPNVSEYSQTLPYFICTEWGTQCVSNCNGVTSCQAACRDDHPCGAQNPTRQNTSTLTRTMMSSTTTSGAGAGATVEGGQTIYTGFAGAAATSSGGNGGSGSGTSAASTMVRVWALSAGQTLGSILVFGSMTLGFAVLL